MSRTYTWRLAPVPWSQDQQFVLGYRYGLPLLRRNAAPRDRLATRRQLRARGLRPGGADPVALLMGRHGPSCSRWLADLYLIEHAKPVRAMTPGRAAAIEKALTARRTCRECGWQAWAELPKAHRTCEPCRYRLGHLEPDDQVHDYLTTDPAADGHHSAAPAELSAAA